MDAPDLPSNLPGQLNNMLHSYPFRIVCPVLTLTMIVPHGLLRGQSLTASELLPAVGASYHQYTISDAIPWDTISGTDVIWDYAWITVDSLDDLTYTAISIDDAPAAGDYPATDRVIRTITGANDDYVIDRFYDEQADRLVELGSVGPVLSYVQDMPETVYALPMQFEDTVHSDYCFWSDGLGVQYHFCGESYVTFDAVGTLILPFGTYTDVKHVTHWRSSFETTGPATDSTHAVRQEWFAPGIPYPLLDLSIYLDDIGQLWPSGRVMDLASITGLQEVAGRMTFNVHPNPATDMITIERTATSRTTVEVRALDGRIVQGTYFPEGATRLTLSLEGLADGVYVVCLVGEGSNTIAVVKGSR